MTVAFNQSDAELAGYLAEEAGKLLIQTRILEYSKAKNREGRDRRANKSCDSIRDLRPHDGLLSKKKKIPRNAYQ